MVGAFSTILQQKSQLTGSDLSQLIGQFVHIDHVTWLLHSCKIMEIIIHNSRKCREEVLLFELLLYVGCRGCICGGAGMLPGYPPAGPRVGGGVTGRVPEDGIESGQSQCDGQGHTGKLRCRHTPKGTASSFPHTMIHVIITIVPSGGHRVLTMHLITTNQLRPRLGQNIVSPVGTKLLIKDTQWGAAILSFVLLRRSSCIGCVLYFSECPLLGGLSSGVSCWRYFFNFFSMLVKSNRHPPTAQVKKKKDIFKIVKS